MSKFQKATKHEARLRLALIGPAGTGKTYSALAVATALVPGGRVAVIDTERGSASKYADQFAFDVLNLDRHSPTDYVAAIREAEAEGYDVVVIDSLSHAWSGKGGALELVDAAAKRARTPNTFGAWREVTPLHNEMVDAIVGCRAHVIVTMRAKTEWVQEQDERGKTRIRKVGLAPVQRDGLEYEFDVVGDLDVDHALLVTKTRCSALAGAMVVRPGAEFAEVLRTWLHGAPVPEQPTRAAAVSPEPRTQAPMPEAAPSIEAVLAAFQRAYTEAELLEAGAMARALPTNRQQVARTAYSNRLGQIKWRKSVADRLQSLNESERQSLVDQLGEAGIVLASIADITRAPDDVLDAIATVLQIEEP